MARTPWVGGNWKSNGTVCSITELAKELNQANFDPKQTEVVVFPVALHINLAKEKLNGAFQVGCQNISKTGPGAYTGEITAGMAKDFGLKWVLVGHSERRQYYGETNQVVAEKVGMIMKEDGLHVAICIGEMLEEREGGKTMEVCRTQLDAVIPKVTDWGRVVIAYEPVWAIGTGKVATPEQAQEVHADLRKYLAERVSKEVADKLRIVYGGSVTDQNCVTLIGCPDVDGFLVGGASLKKAFVDIIKAPTKA
ncbi:triosephosphate isomerase, cytosolic [Cyclospora cayetanensis]|uniref:Triosephosphate isomerase n=2 Tax=Cyclospora cayetanensis TaxID=88456 RepID=A0A1D3D112_9EIME|nr:triosephosphate isomerase, cytosolic [Cyclospora cayetanensis]OEH77147.1 triosephosphate isomerase [Cyclospora cayetanensis]